MYIQLLNYANKIVENSYKKPHTMVLIKITTIKSYKFLVQIHRRYNYSNIMVYSFLDTF